MNFEMKKQYINYIISIIIAISYVDAFPNGAPSKTCLHYLPIGSGKSHHGSYPVSDPSLTLTLFDNSNKIVTKYQSNSIYTLQISSINTYTGYLFGAFDSVSDLEYGSLSYFTDDKISKQISGVGCITQSNQVSLKTSRIIWTSPSSTESVLHLQCVVTFDKKASIITISVKGENLYTMPINGSESVTDPAPTLNKENLEDSGGDKIIITGNIIIIIVLSGFLVIIAIISGLSFFKIISFKSVYKKKSTNDELNINKNIYTSPTIMIV